MDEEKDGSFLQKHKRIFKIIGIIIGFLVAFVSLLIATSISWMFRTWTGLTMNELMFHIQSPLQGTDSGIIVSYILSCVLVTIGILCFTFVLYRMIKKKKGLVLLSTAVLSVIVAGSSIQYMWKRLDIKAYASNKSTYSTFIDDNYVSPQDVEIQFPEQKRNLIYIYLESVENTFSDKESGGAFKENVIPELTELSNQNENFSGDHETLNGGISFNGTGWTVAAMFAQSSGLPLMIPVDSNAMNEQESFLPGLTTIGDILQEAGYDQSLLIGSDADFGGRKLLFTQHGGYNIYDYYYSKENGEIPEDYHVFWGYEDKKLFEFAKQRLLEVSSSNQPFNLTMLTVDTHFEDGYVCEDCQEDFQDDQYANVIACSSKRVAEFVQWVQKQDFYDNTTIVISGDHPTMDSDFCEDVDEDYQRKVYTTYINSAASAKNNVYRDYSTFDNFPTTLASLGVKIEGNRLGLGTNLFSSEATLLEKFDKATVDNELDKKSELMEKLTEDIVVPQESEEIGPEVEEDIPESAEIEITVTPYDFKTGKYDVLVQNLPPAEDSRAVRCAVWAEEDQSDLKWYEAELQDDGTYMIKVWAADFAYKVSEYNIHVYVVNGSGDSELLGSAAGAITR
ncbi:GBS Bsp-like repeat-containing protein [Blautia marasmi]|uniref:GBS Bsp-like repeat-containing protein n=1 Tax=Blautia marasmi TaxID=1917868 RepID=UPI00142D6A44|nr:GBS Bsp-like repeat-containing protein [Blautia marasmi]